LQRSIGLSNECGEHGERIHRVLHQMRTSSSGSGARVRSIASNGIAPSAMHCCTRSSVWSATTALTLCRKPTRNSLTARKPAPARSAICQCRNRKRHDPMVRCMSHRCRSVKRPRTVDQALESGPPLGCEVAAPRLEAQLSVAPEGLALARAFGGSGLDADLQSRACSSSGSGWFDAIVRSVL
jgi:hypothetical protein